MEMLAKYFSSSVFFGSGLVIQYSTERDVYKKAKVKVKKFVAQFPSRSQPTPSATTQLRHRSSTTNTSDKASVASPFPSTSIVADPPLLSASLHGPPSTPAQADELGALPSASASETTLPRSTQGSKSKIAKDLFKTTLLLLNTTLAGAPLPCKGVFTAVIEIIKIVEVMTSYYREFERNFS
jgi:hypothetical protein